jgi:hypothetical protein
MRGSLPLLSNKPIDKNALNGVRIEKSSSSREQKLQKAWSLILDLLTFRFVWKINKAIIL